MATSPFKVPLVDIRDIPIHRRVDVGGAYVSDLLAGLAVRDALEAPAADPAAGAAVLEADLYADDTTVFVNGSIKGHVRIACGRCVGEVDIPFDEKIRVTYVPRSELETDEPADAGKKAEPDADEGVELDEGDLDLFPYDGDAIDLEPLVREQVILAVPYAPLCREDCAGLCSQCGADLNAGACGCEKPIDPRFEALKGLKLPS